MVHFDRSRYHPQLQPSNKRRIHELAMNSGVEDPLRVDYRQMIKKGPSKPQAYLQVEPLHHGHLTNLQFTEENDRNEAATRIQSLYRSYKERRFAEVAAKRRAFEEAKALAVLEVKNNLIAEFRARESGSGMARMKWDAQVRLQQGKLRALGEVVSRADTVMIMMEEALQRATEEIERRFRDIQSKEEFGHIDTEVKEVVVDDTSAKLDVFELFGLSYWSDNNDFEDQLRDIHTPRPDEDSDDEEELAKEKEHSNMIALSSEQVLETLEGAYVYDPSKKGENKLQREFRHAMAFPAPETQHLVARLRAIDSVFTAYKVAKFISETPSKRLLMLMVDASSIDQLALELRDHFKLARNHKHIAAVLKSICHSDLEFGILPLELSRIQFIYEKILQRMVQQGILGLLEEYNKRVESRIQSTSTHIDDSEIVDEELQHTLVLTQKFEAEYGQMNVEFSKARQSHRLILLSIRELERRALSLENLGNYRSSVEFMVEIRDDDRQKWMERMAYANSLSDDSLFEKEAKYTEIVALCKEFVDTATSDAMTIIREYYLPNLQRTIFTSEEKDIDGRGLQCGRGIAGKKHVFEAHNIVYSVCLDDDGIFNGSDDCAAKAAGNERLFSLQYSSCHVSSLHVPLIVTVDYHGFRVLAQSKAPITRVSFNDKGEAKLSAEDLVHGVTRRGDVFINRSKLLQTLLAETARILNLAEHSCRGASDISGTSTHSSAEIKVYKGMGSEFYLRDFWTSFPSEVPDCTPHLLRSPRDQSVYWRRLRPELCRNFDVPLSPDACSTIVYHTTDQNTQLDNVRNANMHLFDHKIPQFVKYLVDRTFTLPLSDGLGVNLSNEFHVRGINIRHVGLVRSKLWHPLPGRVSLFNNERYIRCSHDIRGEIRNGDIVRLGGLTFTVCETNKRKIEHDRIPIDRKYKGRPIHNVAAKSGTTISESNCESLRSVLLAEMIVRTVKHLIRGTLRQYAKRTKGISVSFLHAVVCEYLNVITGASSSAERILEELVYPGIRERFGSIAVTQNEQFSLFSSLQLCVPYAVHRLVSIFDVQISLLTLTEFHQRPVGFSFCVSDILSIQPVVRNNMAVLPFGEAILAAVKAYDAEQNTYREQVLQDAPLVYLQLYERKGSRIAENIGGLGVITQGLYSKGCELYLPGPVVGDSFSKSVGFKADTKSYVTLKFHEKYIPQDQLSHFTVEIFAKCQPSKEVKRVAYMCGRFGLIVNRENYWVFQYIFGVHEGIK